MKQGKFTLRKLSQIWGDNHQSLNTQLPELSEGAYSPTYPTQSEYRTGGASLNTAIDDSSETWTNVQAINSDTGETGLSRTSSEQIPINVWGDLLLNGRKVIKEYAEADSPYFTSLQLMFNTGFDKNDLQAGEFCFADDGNGDIFLNDGAEIVRFIRSDSHVRYENINDVVVREINWIDSVEPSTNLYEGALWYNTTDELIYRYDGNDFLKVYYPLVDDNDGVEYTEEGTGQPKYNVVYVYAPFDAYNVKVPTDIYYWNGSKLVSFGGNGGNGAIYAVCTTAISTADKEITITSAATSYADLENQQINIRFTNGSNATGVCTLNVNGLGAINFKNLHQQGANVNLANIASNGIVSVLISNVGGTYEAVCLDFIEAVAMPNEVMRPLLWPTSYQNSGRAVAFYSTANVGITRNGIDVGGGYDYGGISLSQSGIRSDVPMQIKNYIEIDPVDAAVKINASKYLNITTVGVGDKIDVQKSVKRVSIYVLYDPDTDGFSKNIYKVPPGYLMVNATGSGDFKMGLAWHNSTETTGPVTNIDYTGKNGAVTLTQTPNYDGYNTPLAFSSTNVPEGDTYITVSSADTGKGPVVIYGEYILVPDGAL